MVLDLTIEEIKDLAEFSGLTIDPKSIPSDDEMEEIVCIANCPKEGLENEDGEIEHFNYVMYLEQCPEEGCIPLGKPKEKSIKA